MVDLENLQTMFLKPVINQKNSILLKHFDISRGWRSYPLTLSVYCPECLITTLT